MQPTLVFNCFKLCLLVVLCTAAPGADTDLSSGSANEERIVKLKGDPDQLSDSADDGRIAKLQGSDKDEDTGAVNDMLSGSVSSNEGPINAEENNDNLVTYEEIDDENKDNEGKDEPKDGENIGNEEQGNDDYIPAPNSNEETIYGDQKGAINDNPNNALPSESNSVDNYVMEQDGNSETSPSPSETKEAIQSITKDCKAGTNGFKHDLNKLSVTPGFQLSMAEMTKFKIWPEAKIPYYIDELSYDKVLRDKIRSYLDEARSYTGLHFEELTEPPVGDDERWVFFVNRRGQLDCKDYNTNSFTNTGVQKVIIGYNCLIHGGPMAAIVLALVGVPPQHNSPDRDRYIKVVTDHILPDKKGLFKPLKDGDWLFHDLRYDFDSVSHYPSHQYTADGSETIQVRDRSRPENTWIYLDEKRTYSCIDLLKVRYLYNHILLNKLYGIKPEDCKALYRPGPNYKNLKLNERKRVPVRPKPRKYLAAAGNENGVEMKLDDELGNVDIEAAQLSSLEPKTR